MRILNTILAFLAALLFMQNPAWNSLGNSGVIGSGAIIFIDGTITKCPTGYSEISSTGNYLILTSSGAGDVGTTGGSNSYTPAGTNATAAFTPSGTVAWPAGVPTFAGSAMGTHLHGAGTLADATSGSTVKLFTSSASGVSAATLSGSTAAVSAGTPAGTVAWPAVVPTFSGSGGTVPAQTFTGTQATIQPTFIKLIGCKKT